MEKTQKQIMCCTQKTALIILFVLVIVVTIIAVGVVIGLNNNGSSQRPVVLVEKNIGEALWIYQPQAHKGQGGGQTEQPLPILGGEGILPQPTSSTLSPSTPTIALNNIIPLYWDAKALLYSIEFNAGKSLVSAAFDTGSTNFVVASKPKGSLQTNAYELNNGGQPIIVKGGTICTNTVSYVSQTETVQLYRDTLSFPRKSMASTQLCTKNVSTLVNASSDTTPLIIQSFPVGAAVSNGTGTTTTVNVFGMASVLATQSLVAPCPSSTTGNTNSGITCTQWYLPNTCQTATTQIHVSPIIESIDEYYKGMTASPTDTIWSMMLGTPSKFYATSSTPEMETGIETAPSGFVSFGAIRIPCLRPDYTPLVPRLLTATGISSNEYQYYVVEVMYCAIGKVANASNLSSFTKLKNFPQYLILDTGTTVFLLPGSTNTVNADNIAWNATSLNTLGVGDMAVIVLTNNVVISFEQDDVSFQETGDGGQFNPQPVFQVMPSSTASNFSTADPSTGNYSVGIMGCTAMRNLYIEFNLTKKTVGFAQVTL